MTGATEPQSLDTPRRFGALAFFGLLALPTLALLAALGKLDPLAGFGPFVFGALAWPFLRIAAPAEPSRLKLAYFALLLSPPATLLVWLVLRGVGAAALLPHALVALPLLAWALIPRLTKARTPHAAPRERLGGAQLVALLVGLAFALGVHHVMLGGSLARVSFHGLLHSAITEAVEAAPSALAPPENPWLAGHDLGYYWLWHALAGAVGQALALTPTQVFAWLDVWAAATLPLGLYLWVAGFGGTRSGARDLFGMLLGLAGLNLLGGYVWLASGAPYTAPEGVLDVLANLRELVFGGIDPRVAWGPSKFGNVSSYPVALALLVGGLVAGSHALASGPGPRGAVLGKLAARVERTWGTLACLALGAAFAFNPLVGAVGLAAVGAPALLRGRRFLWIGLGLAALPGVWEVVRAGAVREQASVGFAVDGGRLMASLWPVLPLFVLGALGLLSVGLGRSRGVVRGARGAAPEAGDSLEPAGDAEERWGARAFTAVAGWGAGLSFVIAVLCVLPEANEYKFVRTAALCAAPLAAVGWGRLAARSRVLGSAVLALCLVGMAGTWTGARSYLALASMEAPLSDGQRFDRGHAERGDVLPRAAGLGADLARAYAFLRDQARRSDGTQRPLLLMPLPAPGEHGARFGKMGFDGPANLAGHSAAAFSGCALLADRASYLVESDPAWPERLALVRGLYEGAPGAKEALARTLAEPALAGRRVFAIALIDAASGLAPDVAPRLPDLAWPVVWQAEEFVLLERPGN